jgi:hypothetical protein
MRLALAIAALGLAAATAARADLSKEDLAKLAQNPVGNLVNIPHQMFMVSSVGDMYAPKHAAAAVEARYQSMRLIAAYDAAQLPK